VGTGAIPTSLKTGFPRKSMKITTVLQPGFVEVHEEDPNVPMYEISWKDYKDIIDSLADSKTSGPIMEKAQVKLCPGVVSISPEFFTAKSGPRSVTIEIPEVRSDIRYHRDGIKVYRNCIFPTTRMILDFTRSSNSSTDDELKFSGMRLRMIHNGGSYHYPFPNVHSNDAVCWGSVSLPTFVTRKNLEGATLYMAAFREANFNADLTPNLNKFGSLHEYFKHLSTAEKFPYANFM